MKFRVFSFLLLAAAAELPSLLVAQSTGTISGFVTDPAGSAVPAAKVTATHLEQQMQRTVETNGEGFYTFNALPPGDYSLSAERTGFQRLVRKGDVLTLNQNLRVDLSLQLGQISQEISVSGHAPLVDTQSGALSALVDDRRVVDLPLSGRNVIGLSATLPGIANVSSPQQLSDARSGPTMNVNGGYINQNLFTFNGGIFVNPSRETAMNYPPPDAVKEFSIQTQDFSAEFGRNAGSQVNVVSKSGTNEFHGSAWEFLRNDDLNARNFFAATVPTHKQNQYGAAAGSAYCPQQGLRFRLLPGHTRSRRRPQHPDHRTVRPAARRAILPALGKTLTNPVDPLTGQPLTDSGGAACVQNNIVRSTCISPARQDLLPLIPQSATGTLTHVRPPTAPGRHGAGRGRTGMQAHRHTVSGHAFVDRNLLNRLNLVSGSIPNYLSGSLSAADQHGDDQ